MFFQISITNSLVNFVGTEIKGEIVAPDLIQVRDGKLLRVKNPEKLERLVLLQESLVKAKAFLRDHDGKWSDEEVFEDKRAQKCAIFLLRHLDLNRLSSVNNQLIIDISTNPTLSVAQTRAVLNILRVAHNRVLKSLVTVDLEQVVEEPVTEDVVEPVADVVVDVVEATVEETVEAETVAAVVETVETTVEVETETVVDATVEVETVEVDEPVVEATVEVEPVCDIVVEAVAKVVAEAVVIPEQRARAPPYFLLKIIWIKKSKKKKRHQRRFLGCPQVPFFFIVRKH